MELFLARHLMLMAINAGYSSPASLRAVATELGIDPKMATNACTWLAQQGFVKREAGPKADNAPSYITFAYHYKPAQYAKLDKRMTLFAADVQRQNGFGWDLANR